MNRNDHIDATLRSLDPADHDIDSRNARARKDLHAILASDPAPSNSDMASRSSATPARSRRTRRTGRRVALISGVAVAVTAGIVLVPSLSGGDTAFATWTKTPDPVSEEQRAEAADSCREQLGSHTEYADDLGEATTAIADRRGAWTTVVLAGADGFGALCITDDTEGLFGGDMIGSIGTPTDYTAPGPRELTATDLGVGGKIPGGEISVAVGNAGSDVTGVVFHSRDHGDVEATVNQGRFALWFPGDEEVEQVDVIYLDGTTATTPLHLG